MSIKIFIAIFLTASSLTAGQDQPTACGSNSITCVCGIGAKKRYVPLELEMQAVEDPFTGKPKCVECQDPYQECAKLSCYLASNKSEASLKDNGIISYLYPIKFTIPSGGLPEGHRFTRQAGPCHVTPLDNAEIQCWKWPKWMNCDIKCIYGYGIEDEEGATVTTKNIHCRDNENTWIPHGFRDCQPFLNCRAHLVKPGVLNCKEPLTGPPYCEISCLEYDDYEATKLQKYECADENFPNALPHCAVVSEKVALLDKPIN